ncbi:MAG: hypothetical protein CL799_05885 [Chromatiales bacterium]|jgi:hypothetical protein|nr:hypothetical protein [Chromatiales bacterium]MDP6151313.1 hypothetical protein [Gammaproteobacteria bacterium]MDP7271822.1 hypothetical protein [Gammaproteobacteria bacterium]HJP04673.1 hypothetical protein [Gammaproteobacteria bacterium]
MLGAIRSVTVSAPDLAVIERAYGEFLDYRATRRGKVSPGEAEAWQAGQLAGAPLLIMSPATTDDFEFRFIQQPIDSKYVPLTSYGWNASEIIVRDVDAMAERIKGSPFETVGEPRNLSFSDDIRAMQLRGPASEIVYLTEFKKPVPGLSVPRARSDVDRTFIVILGGRSMDELQDYYHDTFGVPRAPVVESRITMLSKALGVSIETEYPIAAMALEGESLIEADEMPAQVGPRRQEDGLLPPGIAIVGFDCDAIPPGATPVEGTPGRYIMLGPTGEIIELFTA